MSCPRPRRSAHKLSKVVLVGEPPRLVLHELLPVLWFFWESLAQVVDEVLLPFLLWPSLPSTATASRMQRGLPCSRHPAPLFACSVNQIMCPSPLSSTIERSPLREAIFLEHFVGPLRHSLKEVWPRFKDIIFIISVGFLSGAWVAFRTGVESTFLRLGQTLASFSVSPSDVALGLLGGSKFRSRRAKRM